VRLFLLSIGLLFVAAVGSAIDGEKLTGLDQAHQKTPNRGPVSDYPSLIKGLRALGVGATATGKVDQPFFSITGRMIKVHGEDVQVFQYANAAAADAEAVPISRDGRAVGTRKIHWIGSPHFFKKEKLLVLYVGDNDRVLGSLEAVLGQQFAGQSAKANRE
jgi:hypothetical protein